MCPGAMPAATSCKWCKRQFVDSPGASHPTCKRPHKGKGMQCTSCLRNLSRDPLRFETDQMKEEELQRLREPGNQEAWDLEIQGIEGGPANGMGAVAISRKRPREDDDGLSDIIANKKARTLGGGRRSESIGRLGGMTFCVKRRRRRGNRCRKYCAKKSSTEFQVSYLTQNTVAQLPAPFCTRT